MMVPQQQGRLAFSPPPPPRDGNGKNVTAAIPPFRDAAGVGQPHPKQPPRSNEGGSSGHKRKDSGSAEKVTPRRLSIPGARSQLRHASSFTGPLPPRVYQYPPFVPYGNGPVGPAGPADPNQERVFSGSSPSRPPRGFNAMNELSSVMTPNNPPSVKSGGRHRRAQTDSSGSHRRAYTDSGGAMPLPPMPPMGYPSQFAPNQFAPNQFAPNQFAPNQFAPNPPLPSGGGGSNAPRGVFTGAIGEGAAETDAFLQSSLGNPVYGAGGGGRGDLSRRSHMRQNSVNVFMREVKGAEQPRVCRNASFAVLFILQLAGTCFVGLRYGPEALLKSVTELDPNAPLDDDETFDYDFDSEEENRLHQAYWNIIKISSICGAFAVGFSALALGFMIAMSRRLVYVALVLSIGVSFAWGTIGIGISPKSFVPVTGIIALMLSVGYTFVVWDRIPFASANLTTALSGVRDNPALVAVAFFFQCMLLVFSIYYTFAFVGLHDVMYGGYVDMNVYLNDNSKIGMLALLLISFYWTYQVLVHIVVVTVAGTIGSWWFDKPSALGSTFLQATVFNFGSICYGSLFVGPVQFLRQITEGLRPNREHSAMMCLYECSLFFQERIVGCVDNLNDSFTPWAFTYIGLYHYGLKEAGHKANELFEMRGWTRLVTDDLIHSVLYMVSLVIGGLTGSFAVLFQALEEESLTSVGHTTLSAFMVGFLIGIVLSSVLFSIISSSVAAVIVCFAGSPVEFQKNHPELSNEMREAWREVWPGSLDSTHQQRGSRQLVPVH